MRMLIGVFVSGAASAFVYLAFGAIALGDLATIHGIYLEDLITIEEFAYSGLLYGILLGITFSSFLIAHSNINSVWRSIVLAFFLFAMLTLVLSFILTKLVVLAFFVPFSWLVLAGILSMCCYLLILMGTKFA